jgi:tetratricopeptide (TPR) repeat protein
MKNIQKLIAVFSLCFGFALMSQAQELPAPSPAAKVEQRIGLTDVSVTYSRPGVKGREIWGGLEKWDVMWRAGANAATLVEFSDDVTVAGKAVPAGKYAFYLTPSQGEWTVTFNKGVENWGVDGYKAEEDVATFKVKSKEGALVESLRYTFENITLNSGDLVMAWEKVRIHVPVAVDVEKKAWANIEKALAETEEDKLWRVYRNAAGFAAESGKNLDQAMKWVNKSLELKDTWYTYTVKSQVQEAQGDIKAALASMKTSIAKGEEDAREKGEEFGYRAMLDTRIAALVKKQ